MGDISGACWGQAALSASPSPPAAREDTLPRAACPSAPTLDSSRHCLTSFPSSSFPALRVADLHPPGGPSSATLHHFDLDNCSLYLPTSQLDPSTSASHAKPVQIATTLIFLYFFYPQTDQTIWPPNQRIAPSVLCSKRIYSCAAQSQTDASMQDMPENTILLLCFDNLTFIHIFL